MNIKEKFHQKLNGLREDYDMNKADDAKEVAYIGSGSRRKKERAIWMRDAANLRKQAVTGMDGKKEGKKRVDEALDSAKKKEEYQKNASASFKGAFGKKDSKSVKTVEKRLSGLRMSLKKEETEQLDEGPFSTVGKMMMKRKMKKQIKGHNEAMDKELENRGDEDVWTKNHDAAARKKKVLNRLQKEETEQLDELRRLSDDQKKKLQSRIRDKHDKAWTETERIRKEKKSKGSEDTKTIDKFRNRLAKIHNKLDENNEGYQEWPGQKKKKWYKAPKDASGKTETQKWAEKRRQEKASENSTDK